MTSSLHDHYDAIVVGGSAAGLFAAERLARAGAHVLVLERQLEVGRPTRTLIVTRELEGALGFRPDAAILHEVRHMDMQSCGAQASVSLRESDWIIDRGAMNRLLLERAREAGAVIRLGAAVKASTLEARAAHVTVEQYGREERLAAPVLIGADGVRSEVARALGFGPARVAPLLQARVSLPQGYDPSRVRIWFDRRLTNYFLWLIPDSADSGVLGLVGQHGRPARQVLDDFLCAQGLAARDYQGAVIPLHTPRRPLERQSAGARALLVGDAAAHVKVTTVGGLVSGLLGARAAAQAILRGRTYASELGALRRELLVHDGLRWLLDRYSDADYDRLLRSLTPRTLHWLESQPRDRAAAGVASLLLGQPGLALLPLPALLRSTLLADRAASSESHRRAAWAR